MSGIVSNLSIRECRCTELTGETLVRVSPAALVRDVSSSSVLLNVETGEYFSLDAIGTRIWRLIEERGRLADVCATIVQEYDVAPDAAMRDIADLVGALAVRHLVIVEPRPGP